MTFKLALQLSTAAVLVAVAIRQCVQLVRHRSDLALRVLAPGLVFLAFTATIGIRDFAPSVAVFSMLWRLKIGGILATAPGWRWLTASRLSSSWPTPPAMSPHENE